MLTTALIRDHLLRTDFLSFLHRACSELGVENLQMGWHIEAIAEELRAIEAGESQRLLINIQPRSLKSKLVSVAWVAWRLGRNPRLKFICASYSATLALALSRDCRQIMETEWYRRAFPKTRLRRATDEHLATTSGGGRMATSVGGTLTGFGCDILIVDDPLNANDANSEAARQGVINWFKGTAHNRLDNKATGAIVVVMQRLHEEDLAGYLLEAGGYRHLKLTAIAEEDAAIPLLGSRVHQRKVGDLLQPARESRQILDREKALMGSAAFSAQYQQAPVPSGGVTIQKAWIRRYDEPPERQTGDRIVQAWDCASKTGPLNDWSVCVTALVRRDTTYILNVHREQLAFTDLAKRAVELARLYEADVLLIEDAASGQQLIQHLDREAPRGVPPPIPMPVTSDKVTRMAGVTPQVEAGRLHLPKEASWLADFEREIFAFPRGRHDDQADALVHLLIWVRDDYHEPLAPPLSDEEERLEDGPFPSLIGRKIDWSCR